MNQPPSRPPLRGIPHFPDFARAQVAKGRPPGTPPGAPGAPRLPQLPAPPYSPPIAPLAPASAPQQIQGLSDATADYESALQPTRFNPGVMDKAITVYTFTRRWRAVDVFINVDPGIPIGPRPAIAAVPGDAAISVQVWAIDRGVRTLVATGRYGAMDQAVAAAGLGAGSVAVSNKRLVAYRGPAEKFEVTAYANWSILAGFQVSVAVIGTDQAVPVDGDDDVGVISSSNDNSFGTLQPADGSGISARVAPDNAASAFVDTVGDDNSPIELVWIYAATSVALRWIQVFAAPAGVGPAGRPVASFGPIGLGLTQAIRMPKGFRFHGTGFQLIWSSTATTHTATGAEDSGAVAWYR